jgi:ADP-ribosylglycohydrolase
VTAEPNDLRDRFAGLLLGTALGDALGLPFEGASARAIARRAPRLDRFSLFGGRGFVSDDTEQTAFVARCLMKHPRELEAARRAFRASLLGWFWRLPWGIGLGTLAACVRLGLGVERSGSKSAGNGAAMRAAIIGAFFCDAPSERRRWSDALAHVTHSDPRAVEGARYVAELAALCTRARSDEDRDRLVSVAAGVIEDPSLKRAIFGARNLAESGADLEMAARELGCSGYVVHSVGLATFCFLASGGSVLPALGQVIRAGGDTDSNAAIVGAWVGALHGERMLPAGLVAELHDADWLSSRRRPTLAGPVHLRALADGLLAARRGEQLDAGEYNRAGALVRNLMLFPVVLLSALRIASMR